MTPKDHQIKISIRKKAQLDMQLRQILKWPFTVLKIWWARDCTYALGSAV